MEDIVLDVALKEFQASLDIFAVLITIQAPDAVVEKHLECLRARSRKALKVQTRCSRWRFNRMDRDRYLMVEALRRDYSHQPLEVIQKRTDLRLLHLYQADAYPEEISTEEVGMFQAIFLAELIRRKYYDRGVLETGDSLLETASADGDGTCVE